MDRLHLAAAELHWWVLAFAVALHATASWALLAIAGEDKLAEPASFIYWYATTAYTVGYGDLSPQTIGGRLVTAAFVFPGAIASFTTIVAKVLGTLGAFWRKRRAGYGDFRRMTETIVLIGFDPDRTPRMISELHADARGGRIVLLTRKELSEPDARVLYVKARSLADPEDLARATVPGASRIAICAETDADTLAAALAVTALNTKAHVVCFFEEEHSARLLRAHCPRVECVSAPGAEIVVQAVQNPGASRVLGNLVSHLDRGVTLYSMEWTRPEPTTFRQAAQRFLDADATLLAWQPPGEEEPSFDLRSDRTIAAGARLFYVANARIPQLQGARA